MKKTMLKGTSLFLLILITSQSFAKEGMWIPAILGAVFDDMRANGLQLSEEDLYAVNQSSIKDAIVLFGGGCTGEIISDRGLLFTNHHCGFDYIQSHSSLTNDYLTNGFWAMDDSQELSCPGLTVSFVVRMEDVTEAMLLGIDGSMSPEQADQIKSANRKALENKWSTETGNQAVVKTFNYGNQFLVVVTRTYRDVRLVGAPPSAIGKFGGDTDNWVWPRHTGDFSVFRIYAGTENEPADFNATNKPYSPAHHFPVSLDGVHEGDFSMVYGFPGRTDHFLTSYAVDYLVNQSNPVRIAMRTSSLDILKNRMRGNDLIRIQYASKQSGIANAWKKWIGQNEGLIRFDALEKKRTQEAAFRSKTTDQKFAAYAGVLDQLKELYGQNTPMLLARDAFTEYALYGPEIFAFANGFQELATNYEKLKSEGKLQATLNQLKADARLFYKDFNLSVEEEIWSALTPSFIQASGTYVPERFLEIGTAAGKKTSLADQVYLKSVFADSTALLNLLDKMSPGAVKKISSDKIYKLARDLFDNYDAKIKDTYLQFSKKLEPLMRTYVHALMEMDPRDDYWADANSTLRLTYGKVEGSEPRDGMAYTPFTTGDGILEKANDYDPDFFIPQRLKNLLEAHDFGIYGENGQLPICYTGSNHTTGGNSGSPALNARGELVGINFDRSWESTMSDITYNPEICRNIMVDIRYVLWVIDKYADCGRLLSEMTLVHSSGEAPETR